MTKEKNEVRKTKKKFEKESLKMAKMMEITQQNDQNIRRILNFEKMIDNNGAMVSTSSRIHQRNSSSNNVAGDAPPVTDSYRGSTKGANQGKSVLTMINERDADSKQSQKSREVRQHH